MKKFLFLVLFLCIDYNSNAQIILLPVFGQALITEDAWFVTKNGDTIQFDNIRFYISNIQFEMDDKSLIKDSEKAHLIDVFEPKSLKIDIKNADLAHIKRLCFNIGMDSLTSVSGVFGGDLDPQKGMYWAWQSGYINMKIEGRSPQCKSRKNVFQYHIGGYMQPFYCMKNIDISIENRLNTEGVILKVDASKFFENIQMATQNSIMIPCKEAMQLADYSIKMFSISAHEK
jgi:hypothetical protein